MSNREYLYRGKRKDNGEWVYGMPLMQEEAKYYVMIFFKDDNFLYESEDIIPETVGEYTGLKDKNDKRIFEGDVVKFPHRRNYGVVKYERPECRFEYATQGMGDYITMEEYASSVEVIGNIHDNPELLEVDNDNTRSN